MSGRFREYTEGQLFSNLADFVSRSLAKSGGKVGAAILPFPESRDARSSQPRYSVVRSFDFEASLWPGYEHRRTIGHKEGKSSLLDREHAKARTWELALAPEIEND